MMRAIILGEKGAVLWDIRIEVDSMMARESSRRII